MHLTNRIYACILASVRIVKVRRVGNSNVLVNGLQIDASQEERARWVLDLAAVGRTAEEKDRELATRLRKSTVPHPDDLGEGEA